MTELISVGPDGLPAGGSAPSISGDGRLVAFRSFGVLVDDGQVNFFEHAYVYDRRLQKMERVDVTSDGIVGSGSAFNVIISGTGRHVAFDSFASDLARGDGDNGGVDVFVRDRRTAKTEAVSIQGSTDTIGSTASSRRLRRMAASSASSRAIPRWCGVTRTGSW